MSKEEYGTFSINVKGTKHKNKLIRGVFDYKHLENMLVILQSQSTPSDSKTATKEDWKIFRLLTNFQVMKAVLTGNKGSKLAEKIEAVNSHFAGNNLFYAMVEHAKKLNDKNCSMIVRRTKGSWETFFTQIGEYKANPAAFAAKYGSPHPPQPPKAKKLQRLNNASLPLEGSKFSIKSAKVGKKRVEVLGLTVWKKQILVPLKHKGMITKVGIKNINNAKLSYSNGFLFVDFTYIKAQGEAVENAEENKEVKLKPIKKRKIKRAGLDIGLNNLFSLFIDDRDSKSVIYSGRELKSRNAKFNRFNAKLNESIANEVTEWREKTRTRKDGDGNAFSEVIKYPVSHSQRGEQLKKYKSFLIEKRNLYFDTEFHKITANLVKYLVKQGVTDLVLSKNLSFAKTEGDITLGKKVMQNFMQIPFGRMLNKLEEKCVSVGIAVHFIDEAWTSKTSCISGNVNSVQRKAAKSRQSVLTTDLNGSRVKRGMFKDKTINKVFNADLNGAVNHIKVGFKRAKFEWLKNHLFKLCNPTLLKSNHDFSQFLAAE